jgi:hypothetical protein
MQLQALERDANIQQMRSQRKLFPLKKLVIVRRLRKLQKLRLKRNLRSL